MTKTQTQFEILSKKAFSLLNEGKYSELKTFLNSELDKSNEIVLIMEIAGFLIDLGVESKDKESAQIGLNLIIKHRDSLKRNFTEESIEYNIGNGYGALYMLSAEKGHDWFITPELAKGNLFDAKQSYFRAFKLINLKNLDEFSIQVLTNLGNNLNHSGRIVEALQLFDVVLKHNPDFPQALISKADTLSFMISRSRCSLSVSLFAEIYYIFQKGLSQSGIMPPDIEEAVKINLQHCKNKLKSLNFDFNSIEREFELNQKEYAAHPKELKFYLDNFLSLSEHSLYCKCSGAARDDLMIGFPGLPVVDRKLVLLEHLLNRIKSEFSFARKQLFEYKNSVSGDNIHYESFGVHSVLYGTQIEKLRISFRLCFSIFDKIAQGILHLFDLQKGENENVYFESFWKKQKTPDERWEKFNSVKNIHLTALYSIACDLSKHNGEFSYYKKWRNQLEHDFFSIIPKDAIRNNDILGDSFFSEWTTNDDFETKAFHLLQLVRSAIFSFTFCCREELLKDKTSN